jgi:phage gp36-like protein
MTWRRLTKADLAAALSQKEIDAFRQSVGCGQTDPVGALLSRTAEMARGFCRANRAVKLSEDAEAVPGSLIAACCDYAAFDVLKRLPVPVGEDRRRAREQALDLFKAVARGEVTPESAEDAGDSAAAGSPESAPACPPRLLD